MSSLRAAYFNELYKISRQKKITVAALLSLAGVAMAGLIVSGVNNFMGIRIAGVAGFFVLILQVFNHTLIPLFTAFVCIDMLTGEFGGDKTIKLTLTRPASRGRVYLAKTMAAATFLAAQLAFTLIVSYAVSFLIRGAQVSFGHVLAMYAASFFPLMVFALMVMMIAGAARGSASAFLFSLLAFLVFLALPMIFPAWSSFFYTSAFGWYNLFWSGFFNVGKIVRVFLVLAGYGIVFYSVGYWLFDRRDI